VAASRDGSSGPAIAELAQACVDCGSICSHMASAAEDSRVPGARVGIDVSQWPSLVSEKAFLSWQMLTLPRMPP
jgi:hypothetical protein